MSAFLASHAHIVVFLICFLRVEIKFKSDLRKTDISLNRFKNFLFCMRKVLQQFKYVGYEINHPIHNFGI